MANCSNTPFPVLSVLLPDTMREALRLVLDLDDYERVPDDMEEYGKAVLRRFGADGEIIDAIDGYMDFAAMGGGVYCRGRDTENKIRDGQTDQRAFPRSNQRNTDGGL